MRKRASATWQEPDKEEKLRWVVAKEKRETKKRKEEKKKIEELVSR